MKKLNKNVLIIIASVLAVILVVLVVVLNPFGKKLSQEEELKKKIETMGKEFYEELYYKQVENSGEEKDAFLKRFETMGIKIDLGTLARYKGEDSEEILKEFVNKKTNKSCDKDKTQAIIYPQSPYNKESYKIEVNLICGFESEKEKEPEKPNSPEKTNEDKKENQDEK